MYSKANNFEIGQILPVKMGQYIEDAICKCGPKGVANAAILLRLSVINYLHTSQSLLRPRLGWADMLELKIC